MSHPLLLIVSMLVITNVLSLAPPHPDYTDFESVHAMRKRLNITFNYRPKHINPEYCRFMTEQECREHDESIQEAKDQHNHAKRTGEIGPVLEYKLAMQNISAAHANNSTHRALLEHHHREIMQRKLRNKPRRLNPSAVSQAKVLVLLVRFTNHANRELPSREYFDEILNGNGQTTNNPAGSFKEWMRYSSMGKYRAVYDVRDWQTSTKSETDMAQGKSGFIGPSPMQEAFTNILQDLDNKNAIDWEDGYVDDWGYTYHLMIIHSGYAAEYGNQACLPVAAERDPKNRIWSQGSSSLASGWQSKEFYQVNGYSMNSAFDTPKCSRTGEFQGADNNKVGIMLHEYNHGFGLPDLYDQDYDEAPLMIGGTSKMAVMSNAYGWKRNGAIPGHHDPWCRYSLQWLDPIEITQDGFYAIQPSEISGHVYMIKHNFPWGEYLMIENRQPIKWDADLPASTGILIWHIDEMADLQYTRGYPGHPNWPAEHYMVSLVQADGNYDIEKGVNIGDEGDFWTEGQVLGPGGDFPNTDSIQLGNRKQTGVKITIESGPGFIMTFSVEGIGTGRAAPNSRTQQRVRGNDPDTTGETIQWVLSMFAGTAALLGLLGLFAL